MLLDNSCAPERIGNLLIKEKDIETQMFWVKAIVSGLIIALISELVRRSVLLGALLTALPLVSILAMSWMWFEGQENELIAQYAQTTFWLLIPSIPMFLLFPFLLRQGWGYGAGLGCSMLLTVVLYAMMFYLLRMFNIEI